MANEFCFFALLTAVAVGCRAAPAREEGRGSGRETQTCTDSVPLLISADSLGPLPLKAPIKNLRKLCPSAREVVFLTSEGNAYPAVQFSFREVKIVGYQFEDSIVEDQPVDRWIIRGTAAQLPGGVPLTATWPELRKAYGDAIVDTEDGLSVMFCKLPTFFFYLDASVASQGTLRDLSVIPQGARVRQLMIIPRPPAGPTC